MGTENNDNSVSASGDDAQPTGIFGKFFGAKKNYKKAKLGQSLSMYYHEEVRFHQSSKYSNSTSIIVPPKCTPRPSTSR